MFVPSSSLFILLFLDVNDEDFCTFFLPSLPNTLYFFPRKTCILDSWLLYSEGTESFSFFRCGPFFNIFIELATILLLFYVLVFGSRAYGILAL